MCKNLTRLSYSKRTVSCVCNSFVAGDNHLQNLQLFRKHQMYVDAMRTLALEVQSVMFTSTKNFLL